VLFLDARPVIARISVEDDCAALLMRRARCSGATSAAPGSLQRA
jgi:hypothetical protein